MLKTNSIIFQAYLEKVALGSRKESNELISSRGCSLWEIYGQELNHMNDRSRYKNRSYCKQNIGKDSDSIQELTSWVRKRKKKNEMTMVIVYAPDSWDRRDNWTRTQNISITKEEKAISLSIARSHFGFLNANQCVRRG